MAIYIEEKRLIDLLDQAVERGAEKVLLRYSKSLSQFMSRREADRKYGSGNVDRWSKEGLIREIKTGLNNSKIQIDRTKIEMVANAYKPKPKRKSRKQ